MTIKVFPAGQEPSFAKANSTFARDETCKATYYIVGKDYDDVFDTARQLCFDIHGVDYDVNWSLEGENYVGVVVEDV